MIKVLYQLCITDSTKINIHQQISNEIFKKHVDIILNKDFDISTI